MLKIFTDNYAIFLRSEFGTKRVDKGERLLWQTANAWNIDFVNLCTEAIIWPLSANTMYHLPTDEAQKFLYKPKPSFFFDTLANKNKWQGRFQSHHDIKKSKQQIF